MKEFLIMVENCRWYSVKAQNANIAFANESCWYGIGTKVAVMDLDEERCFLYTVC